MQVSLHLHKLLPMFPWRLLLLRTLRPLNNQQEESKGHKLVQSFFCIGGPCYHAPQDNRQPFWGFHSEFFHKKNTQPSSSHPHLVQPISSDFHKLGRRGSLTWAPRGPAAATGPQGSWRWNWRPTCGGSGAGRKRRGGRERRGGRGGGRRGGRGGGGGGI